MEIIKVAMSSAIGKLGDMIADEYNLQMGLEGEISSLKVCLENMQVALNKVSDTLPKELDQQDRIWARHLRELSYDTEDKIDTFMVHGHGDGFAELKSIKKFTAFFTKFMDRHELATQIRGIKRSVEELSKQRENFSIDSNVARPVRIDPRVYFQHKNVRELVGIDEAREEVIKILMEGSEVSKQQDKIVSIFGFGGLGKTTLARVVYEGLKTQFDCSAFVPVSQTPDMEKLLKDMLQQLGKRSDGSINIIVRELTEFLQNKRYFIVLDDIWNMSAWRNIKSALPANELGNKIVTTTRNIDIARKAGGAYKLKPLSLNNSRKLLYWRVFGNEKNEDIENCPDKELTEVSDKILKKCAGVPLAIVTMASLLACKERDKKKWYEVYNSVGTGLGDNFDVDNMRKILSFSYYDMPPHLRTCLLYLSMFPEDSYIDKGDLIRLWMAEGFIQDTEPGGRLFELGESYLIELVNRSMVQPAYNNALHATISGCRVHDMVLDFLCLLASEENFVTHDVGRLSQSKKVRRLSLQNSMITNHAAYQLATMGMKQVRSVVVFRSAFELLPDLSRFGVLRVLNLEECDIDEASSLKYLGNLVHLRYLALGEIHIDELPEEIGKLGFLQTLLVSNNVTVLPSSIVLLKHLMCMRVYHPEMPKGIGNLTSLEELSGICTDSTEIIEEMGNLTELRVLELNYTDALLDKSFVECLCKLRKIESLKIDSICISDDELILDGWAAPEHLRTLELHDGGFSRLPVWMNPSFLQHLCSLETYVKELNQEDFQILGRLPALGYLSLRLGHEYIGLPKRFTTVAGSFPCLIRFTVRGYVQPLEFQQGAMPMLETLEFTFLWREWVQIVRSNGGLFDFGLRNLPSLKGVYGYSVKSKMMDVKAVLRRAAEGHPNHPGVGTHEIQEGCADYSEDADQISSQQTNDGPSCRN